MADTESKTSESPLLKREFAADAVYAPHLDEEVFEWKEGCHKCIERRIGPGEREVHVEVIRNFYGPSESDKLLAKLRHAHAQFKNALRTRTGAAAPRRP